MIKELVILAHMAASGWQYDAECCGVDDCVAMPKSRVTMAGGTYTVVVMPGDHPRAKPGRYTIPKERVKISQDDDYHLCASPWSIYCFYIPGGGV
jgi:hypothetical protein